MKLCLICNFQTAGEQENCPRDGTPMVTVGDDPLLGVVVEGRYKIESVIGQGSAGTVYKAVQELIGREVAIKVLHDYLVSDQEFIKRFTQEAKASSRLSHPNIITIYDFGVIPQGGRPYIAMDLLKGTPLSDLLAERNHLNIDEAIPIFKQVCGALAEAHRQGVVHRDIKPENIVLVERSGQKLFPIVVDFGIARLVQEESDVARITRTGTVCGSPTYMSPEQCTSSKVDHRSDLYSLGVVIYETLTGEVPFLSDELVKVMAMHLSDPPKPLNQVRDDLQFPAALEEVVYKALAKNPDQRYQTMEELSEALGQSIKKETDSSVMTIPPTLVPKRHDIAPGPLANDDSLNDARKVSKEFVSPRNKPMDIASLALEELKSKSNYDEEGARQRLAAAAATAAVKSPVATDMSAFSSSNHHAVPGTNFQRGRGKVKPSAWSVFQSVAGKVLVLFLGLVVAGGIFVFAMSNNPGVVRYLPWKATSNDLDDLVKNNKYEQAFYILQDLKAKGKLSKPQTDTYTKVCLALSKQYARQKRYDDAINLLEPMSKSSKEAASLLKRYRQIDQ